MSGIDLRILSTEEQRRYQKTSAAAYGVVSEIHHMDFMFQYIARHMSSLEEAVTQYFVRGDAWAAKVAPVLSERLDAVRGRRPRVLEFASGYGRVTRHLKSYLSHVDIVASDVHGTAMQFVGALMDVRCVLSCNVPALANLEGPYDAIAALSFFSHMPDWTFGLWLAKLAGAIEKGGRLIFTTHGAQEATLPGGHAFRYESEQGDLDPTDYGAMWVTRSYVEECLRKHGIEGKLKHYPNDWFGAQDTYILDLVG